MNLQNRSIKIHQEEMESLVNLKSRLDLENAVSNYAARYQQMGWVLMALNPQDGTDLEVEAGSDPETWVNDGWEPGWPGPEINLGVRTGKESRVMVLEVAKGAGEAILDRYGPWRAECVAVLGGTRERHFFAWQLSPLFASASLGGATEFRWYGEAQDILVPPSLEIESLEGWEWLSPPWETPPQFPAPAVTDFLRTHTSQKPGPEASQPQLEVSLSWQEVYCLVSPFEALRQAFGASYPSAQTYYQGIIAAAATVGLSSPEVLLSLLWHAPGGDVRQYSDGLGYLMNLMAAAQAQPNPGACPIFPGQRVLDQPRPQTRASSVGTTGPARFPGSGLSQQPSTRVAVRTPFSCRRDQKD